MDNKSASCCSSGSSCCKPAEKKELTIDFLYLDLSTCERCQGTETSLDQAIDEVSVVLKAAGFEVAVNKINITSEDLAVQYRFESSPTIRVNGRDIATVLKESCCQECGDLCGDDVECRVWIYEGVEYNSPPKAMIVNAILKEVYSGSQNEDEDTSKTVYNLPDNLKKFFDGLKKK
ncbi:MAG: DUF2703 domain-containing protein [Clostridiaceae bacterium]